MIAVMHEKARERIFQRIADADTARARDHYLDQYIDSAYRATEWDADHWGFDPDRWMAAERNELAGRGGCFYPREVV